MKTATVEIVNRGRGLQLSTSRITVLDLVRYFHNDNAYEEITRWIPTLTHEEIGVIERYYLDHKEKFDEKERREYERRAEQIRLQRLQVPELKETKDEQMARMRSRLEKRRQEKTVRGILPDAQ